MNDGNAKQQIVERIKSSSNILVSVSTNPSVDSLSAALSLTMMLNKMDKHATAVFSGVIPPAISFLQPEKTFEGTVNSLRDFIIALDKEKADRLRYKVEDNVVKVFITPYRTTITENDLMFSQGDFNVDLIIALGVEQKDTLDAAIVAHGRILHDATVVTINSTDTRDSLGSVDWHDTNASSLCEMLMALSEALQPGLIDEPTATALLTGIVAATERFANRHTTPKVMTMSAQLMAAGANQQLIATKLQEGQVLSAPPAARQGDSINNNASFNNQENKSQPLPQVPKSRDGEMVVHHNEPVSSVDLPHPAIASTADYVAEQALQEALNSNIPAAAPQQSMGNLSSALEEEAAAMPFQPPPQPHESTPPMPPQPPVPPLPKAGNSKPSWMNNRLEPPMMGGTLNATSEEALEDKMHEEEVDKRHALLSHDHHVENPVFTANDPSITPQTPEPPSFSPFEMNYEEAPIPAGSPQPAQDSNEVAPVPDVPMYDVDQQQESGDNTGATPTLAEIEAEVHAREAAQLAQPTDNVSDNLDQARQAVTDALGDDKKGSSDSSNGSEYGSGATYPELPSLPPSMSQPAPPVPPMPDFSTLPPLPSEELAMPPMQPEPYEAPLRSDAPYQTENVSTLPSTPVNTPADPGQFRIPGQQ